MAKKKKPARKKWLAPKRRINQWLTKASEQILAQDYTGALVTDNRILKYVPPGASQRVEALDYIASAYTMQRQFEEAYQAVSQALEIAPDRAYNRYNRALLGRYTMRLVQALFDLEKAVDLTKDPVQRQEWTELLEQTRAMAESERIRRGPDFTLEQLREQQELFIQANHAMQHKKWGAAAEKLRQVIEMGDCYPQPWGNLGICLLMQENYDEAEAAFKRALEIEPDYDLARQNLALLPASRAGGKKPQFMLRDTVAQQAKVNLKFQDLD